MNDSQIALYSGMLQVIPILLLAIFLGDREIHPKIRSQQYFTHPIWPAVITIASGLSMLLIVVALYFRVDLILIDIVVVLTTVILFAGLTGTVIDVARSRNVADGEGVPKNPNE